jgi:hypothetical protein
VRTPLRALRACTLLMAMSFVSRASADAPVTRFFDEAPEPHVAARLTGTTDVRTEPSDAGQFVVRLPLGAIVTRIASRGEAVLVEVTDPVDAHKTLVGWVPRAALMPRPPPPPPPAPPDGLAMVHIDGSPEVTLEARINSREWGEYCRAPCDRRLPLDLSYRTAGDGLRRSEPFRLHPIDGRAVLHEDAAATGLGAPLVLMGLGGACFGVGALFGAVELLGLGLGGSGPSGTVLIATLGALGGGALLLLVGGASLAARGTTTVRQPLPRTWARIPTWDKTVERSASSGTSFIVPVISGSF